MTPTTDARMRVVCFLQARLRAADDDEEVEHALTLALNESRAAIEPAFLYRNVIRDAKRSVRRSRQRHPTVAVTEDLDLAYDDPIVDRIAARQLMTRLYERSECLGAVIEAYFLDESVADTADRLGITARQVKHLRQRGLAVAREIVH